MLHRPVELAGLIGMWESHRLPRASFSGSGNISICTGRLERRGALIRTEIKRCTVACQSPKISARSANGAIFPLFSWFLIVQKRGLERDTGSLFVDEMFNMIYLSE